MPNDLTTTRITGDDNNLPTKGANDPTNVVHTTATLPNTYPAQPHAGVHIAWGVIAKVNSPGTSSISDVIFCDTTLTNYVTDVPNAAIQVFKLWSQWGNATTATPAGLGADVEIHWSIKLDNPTAPRPAMGGVVQAKQHMDGHLSMGNVKAASDIQTPIMLNIPFLQSIAKY